MAKFDHFNFIGPFYDWVFGGRSHDELIDLVDLQPQQALLDVGGGTGRITVHFAKLTPYAYVTDTAMRMLREAHAKGVNVVNGEAELLPFCSGCFDRIIMVDAFHHVADHQQSLDELWRLLAPGGRLVIEEPDIRNGWVKLIAFVEKLLLMRSKFFNPDEILQMQPANEVDRSFVYTQGGIAWIVFEKRTQD